MDFRAGGSATASSSYTATGGGVLLFDNSFALPPIQRTNTGAPVTLGNGSFDLVGYPGAPTVGESLGTLSASGLSAVGAATGNATGGGTISRGLHGMSLSFFTGPWYRLDSQLQPVAIDFTRPTIPYAWYITR